MMEEFGDVMLDKVFIPEKDLMEVGKKFLED